MIDDKFVYLVLFISFVSFLAGCLAERIVIVLKNRIAQKKLRKMFGENAMPVSKGSNQFIFTEKGNEENDS